MGKKNLKYLVVLLCMGLFVTGCGTKDEEGQATTSKIEKEVVTEKPKETIAPLNVKKNTLVFSCKTNEKNTPGYQKVEDISCTTFYVYGDMLFLVDSVNKRILLYENGNFKKEFPIGIGCDVVQMYYDKEKNILKTINEDLDERSYVIYKACEIDLETGEVKELDNCSVDTIFSEDGKLTKTVINQEEAEKVALKTVQKLKKGAEDSASIISKSSDGTEYCCSLSSWIYSPNKAELESTILIYQNNKLVGYALPEDARINERTVRKINGTIYQLVKDEKNISIYALAEKVSENNVFGCKLQSID